MLIDIHTHKQDPSSCCVLVVDPRKTICQPHSLFCFGLHPWYIDSVNIDFYKQQKQKAIEDKNFFAIGEIGLDTKIETPIDRQIDIFEEEIIFSKEHQLNIVVHIVGAFNEFIRILKKTKYEGKIIIHGFSGNNEILSQLLKFNTYFSYGHLLFSSSKTKNSLLKTPLNRLFLETDDQSEYSITSIYTECSKIKGIPIKNLADQIQLNFNLFQEK